MKFNKTARVKIESANQPFSKAASAKRIKHLIRKERHNRVSIGRELLKAKTALGHGDFRAWA